MLKRAIWFSIGAAAGSLGSAYAYTRVRDTHGRDTADGLADSMAEMARRVGETLREAEARLGAELDARR